MKILVLNCGSSSVKFKFIDMNGEKVLARGLVEKIGSTGALLRYIHGEEKEIREVREIPGHEAAIKLVMSTMMHGRDGVIKSKSEIDGIGHRVVHGGEEFSSPALMTPAVQEAIDWCSRFAPLHNPHNLKGIQVCRKLMPGILQVAVFDTAFHQQMEPWAYLYAIPLGLYKKLGIRRYGFHGTSHQYVAQQAARILGKPLEQLRLVTCHLGNGASLAAIKDGHSIDTSMGFTPLEGLVMGSRSGDLDPAVTPYLMQREGLSVKDVNSLLNKHSGLLGISGTSNDMREILEAMDRGVEDCVIAYKMFCHRVRKYIGAYCTVLGGVDGIVFTGGIGENSSRVRADCLEGLSFIGVDINDEANEKNETHISKGGMEVLVIQTDEELAIARDTVGVIDETLKDGGIEGNKEAVQKEVASIHPSDRRELLMLWAADQTADPVQLRERYQFQTGKKISLAALRFELERLGLLEREEAVK